MAQLSSIILLLLITQIAISISITFAAEMKGVRSRILKKLKLVTFHLNPPHASLYKHHKVDDLSTLSPSVVLDLKNYHKVDDSESESESESEPEPEPEVEILLDLPKLTDFEEKCPPRGADSVVFYTTSFKSIRKTHDDCKSVKFLLDSLKVVVEERDVSMDKGLREEMWRVVGERAVPPKVFIKGRYIGGAKEVVSLHEQGKLKRLLQGIALMQQSEACNGCGNFRFVICSHCNGSCKVYADGDDDDGSFLRCTNCNENGLVRCSTCCT